MAISQAGKVSFTHPSSVQTRPYTHTHLSLCIHLFSLLYLKPTLHFPWQKKMLYINKVSCACLLACLQAVCVPSKKESEHTVGYSAALPWHFRVQSLCTNIINKSSLDWSRSLHPLCDVSCCGALYGILMERLTLTNVVYRLLQSCINYGWVAPYE